MIAAFLVALKMKGETAAELAGFARAMRERMIAVDAGADVIDTCGTGGDSSGTFNISTAAALVMAGAGARIAKHGNRSLSSSSGSADVLEALGVRIAYDAGRIGSGGARNRHRVSVRAATAPGDEVRAAGAPELKMRTVFNLLGPLANPARPRRQLIGAPSAKAARLMAERAGEARKPAPAYVVHGHGGLDEISTTGPTQVWEVAMRALRSWNGLPKASGCRPDPPGD